MSVIELNRWLTIGIWTTMGLIVFVLLIPTIFKNQIEKHFRLDIAEKKAKKLKTSKRKEAK